MKPSNVMLVANERAALTDFALAEDTLRKRTVSTRIYLDHVAPEVLDGAPTSKQTDVFAAGCTAYRLLTGERPFQDGDFSQGCIPAYQLNPQVPLAVSRALDRALALDPSERYADAEQMQGALSGLKVRTSWRRVEDPDAVECWECELPDGYYVVRLVERPRAGPEVMAKRDRGGGAGLRRIKREEPTSLARGRQRLYTWLRNAVERGEL